MKYFTIFSLLIILTVSCQENRQPDTLPVSNTGDDLTLVAENIIYDVIIKVQLPDDSWEVERLAGYQGDEMISTIFEAVYKGNIKVFEYFSGEELSAKDLEQLEQVPGFERENIGKIQFTESWYFNRTTLQIEKEVISIVLGYETRDPADDTLIGYKAAFRLDLQ